MTDRAKIVTLMRQLEPIMLHSGWTLTESHPNARVYKRPSLILKSGPALMVIVEVAIYDGAPWAHVSLSYADKIPSWEDVAEVKNLFIGLHRIAVQVLPPASEYVNVHPYVLHLWSRLEGPRLTPDFRRGGLI